MQGRKSYIAILAVMTLIPLVELFFTNLGALFNESLRAEIGSQFGLTDQQQLVRLILLSLFDLLAGIGSLLMLVAALRTDQANLIRPGQWLALIGYVGYGLYQVIAGLTIIAATYRGVIFMGVFYIGLGVIGFAIGNKLKRA